MSIGLQGPRCAELVCRSSLPITAMDQSFLTGELCGEVDMVFLSHSKDETAFGAWHFENAWRDDFREIFTPPEPPTLPLSHSLAHGLAALASELGKV